MDDGDTATYSAGKYKVKSPKPKRVKKILRLLGDERRPRVERVHEVRDCERAGQDVLPDK